MSLAGPDALRKEGNALFQNGLWQQAAEKYEAALQELAAGQQDTSAQITCTSNLAACALRLDDTRRALQLCEAVLAVDGSHVKARCRRAIALMRGLPSGARMSLLDAHLELEALEPRCTTAERRSFVREAVEELFTHARSAGIKLPPLACQLPPLLRDLEYLPAVGQNEGSDNEATGTERNLMIVFHGFGGRRQAFADVFRRMRLPKTAVVLLNAPDELPSELLDDPPGYSWFTMLTDDFEFITEEPGCMTRLSALDKTCVAVEEFLQVFVDCCGWKPSEMFFFGYGQGGSTALELVSRPSAMSSFQEGIAAVVGIATEVLPERLRQWQEEVLRPMLRCEAVLLIHGKEDQITGEAAARRSAEYLEAGIVGTGAVHLELFPDRGGEMLRGDHAQESRCLMEFLSDHLHGVGRKGSEEAIRKLGAQPVEEIAWLSQMD